MTLSKTLLDLHDNERQRAVPVCLYEPASAPQGWVIFSVGFGGNRDGYAYLGRSWSQAGLAVAVVEHVGSNLDVLRSINSKNREQRNHEVVRRVQEPEELAARPRDLALVHSHLAERYSGLPLGLGGHSFGSYTVLAALGFPTINGHSAPAIPGVVSTLLASPQPPGMLFADSSYAQLKVPGLILTGTLDHLLNGAADYSEREKVFALLPEAQRNLVILEGVDHMTFAGVGLGLGDSLKEIASVTSTWWGSTLTQAQPAWRRAELLGASLERMKGQIE